MYKKPLNIRRKAEILTQDQTRVIIRYYNQNEKRIKHILDRVLLLSEDDVNTIIEQVIEDFSTRHKNI